MLYLSILILLVYIFYSSFIGVKIAYLFRWSKLNNDGFLPLPTASGLGLAPFILGLLTIISLYFFSGYSAHFHLSFLLLSLIVLHVITFFFEIATGEKHICWLRISCFAIEELYFGTFLILWIFFLFFNSFYYALYQNDALEYMTVARQLFFTNSLNSYPMINQEITSSGFYGPWTHPPLYVCLLYLTQAVQGHSIFPGLARAIAPWIAFLATLIVYSLGGVHSRITAVLSAIICVSTPLFFLGATTSLIDCLPVLGFALTFAFLLGLDFKYTYNWLVIGLITGFSLWTHSQAVLLLPILIAIIFYFFGLRLWKKALTAVFMVLGISLLVSIWPYLKNWMLFGSPISDNPVVFSLPSLKWNEYFDYARGLDNTFSIIQYGILKGWFAFEAFGISFWVMAVGAFIFIKKLYYSDNLKLSATVGISAWPKPDLLFGLCLLFLSIYILGTIASILLGLNLMIKNERYLLVTLPFAAIIGGYGGNFLTEKISDHFNQTNVKKYIYFLITLILFITLGLVFYIIAVAYPSKYLPKLKVEINPSDYSLISKHEPIHERLLKNLPSTNLMLKARSLVPKNAHILSLRPADMYYMHRKMISYLDPLLVSFYQEKSPQDAVNLLKAMGVNYIHVTDYSLPVQYNSGLYKILQNPHLSKIIVSNLANEIYQLAPADGQFKLIKDFTPGKFTWSYYKVWNLMGRKNLFKLMPNSQFSIIRENRLLNFKKSWAVNHRHYSHIIYSKIGGNIFESLFDSNDIVLDHGKEYRVNFDIEGEGFVRFYMLELTAQNQPVPYFDGIVTAIRIGEVVLSKTQNIAGYSKRFIARGDKVIFIIETLGSSALFIQKAKLYKLENK
jgi:4-amino-4-deoxy-L-arabinose transferase-like glycosyltransferase